MFRLTYFDLVLLLMVCTITKWLLIKKIYYFTLVVTFYELRNGVYSRLRSLTTVFLMREFSSPVLVYSGSQARILVSGHLRVKELSVLPRQPISYCA